jgi:hypothetical protein
MWPGKNEMNLNHDTQLEPIIPKKELVCGGGTNIQRSVGVSSRADGG